MPESRVASRSVAYRTHADGLIVTITMQGDVGPFTYDFANSHSNLFAPRFLTLDAAQQSADRLLRDRRHTCSAGCGSWQLLAEYGTAPDALMPPSCPACGTNLRFVDALSSQRRASGGQLPPTIFTYECAAHGRFQCGANMVLLTTTPLDEP